MAYGTPPSLDDVEAYYTDIRHGRPPPPDLLEDLTERYRAIGGSPLLAITEAQARGLEDRIGIKSYVGLKHAPPFIADAVSRMAADGVDRAVGLVLAPHYSKMSVGDYKRRALDAADAVGWPGALDMIDNWHLETGYIDFLSREVRAALATVATGATVVYTAHSLPERIVAAGDPYPDQLRETAEAVSRIVEPNRWIVGWQSGSPTGDRWLGPDILDIMEDEAARGAPAVVVCPCGFVSDHLEVLYDLDIEATRLAEKLGLEFARTAMPNDDPGFLDSLAAVVRRALN
jgi:protoporphyrin/coproporphyrin ferrochelatase